jgi:hypothetical protein
MKRLPVALAASALIIGIVALILWRELHQGRKQLAEMQAQLTALKDAQTPIPAPAAPAQPQAAAVADGGGPAGTAPAAMPPATPPAARASTTDSARAASAATRTMLTSPEGQELMRAQLRAALARQYPDLAAQMGFSPAEAESFLDLLAKQQSSAVGDAMDLVGGSPAAMQESLRKSMEQEIANESGIAKALGGKYQQWQEYQGTIVARQQVGQLRTMLAGSETPLTEVQTTNLAAALGAEQARGNRESRDWLATQGRNSPNVLEDQLRLTTEQNQRLISTASLHLSAPQLDRYKRMLAQQENMIRMMMGAISGAGAPAQGATPR